VGGEVFSIMREEEGDLEGDAGHPPEGGAPP